jgi:hypothetical protein
MTREEISNEYFEWLFDLVCENRYSDKISFEKLLVHLHNIEFRYSIPRDENMAEAGKSLRYRFALSCYDRRFTDTILYELEGPCSVLEMMISLAVHCEEEIMDNTKYGNRTAQWFWGMISSLGLGSMSNNKYDKLYVNEVITKFLDREYEPNGRGGLFTLRHCDRDLRNVEIWYQLLWYLNEILDI